MYLMYACACVYARNGACVSFDYLSSMVLRLGRPNHKNVVPIGCKPASVMRASVHVRMRLFRCFVFLLTTKRSPLHFHLYLLYKFHFFISLGVW